MIRLFVLIGVVATVAVSALILFGTAPEFQMSPKISLLPGYQNGTLIPAPNTLVENEEVEHGIFEVPAEDERELEEAELMAAMGMPGMDMGGDGTAMVEGDTSMSGMNMNADGSTMAEGDAGMSGMNMNPDGAAMVEGDTSMSGMNMNADGSTMAEGDAGMSGMNMNADGAAMAEGDAGMSGMNMNADGAAMAEGDAGMSGMNMNADGAAMSGGDSMSGMAMESEGGLRITDDGAFDRQINLAMEEWRFSDMNIELKRGERIRFNITNTGKIPHEFMFMEMPAMAAVNYRAERADWNLLEHEALYEKSLVLPDGSFSFVVQVQRDGVWMFMCMLPYHMQMGMMGQMATPGLAMDM